MLGIDHWGDHWRVGVGALIVGRNDVVLAREKSQCAAVWRQENLCLVPRFFSTACAMISPEASLRIGLALFLPGFFVIVPSIAAVIGYAAWKGKPNNFGRDMYWTAFVAAGAASGFLMVYAQRMSADVRSWQYLAQLACFGLGVLLFGVAGGCFIGIFTYRRRSSPQDPSE